MRDHGGNIDAALARFGGTVGDWVDLSTGINPRPYPLPNIAPRAWTALPTAEAMARLGEAARFAYATDAEIVPVAGAQAAIQAVPRLGPPGSARVLAPTYNEHAGALRAAGRPVEEVSEPEELAGAAVAVAVTPNNPDGRVIDPETLARLAATVGWLVVDESFADPTPAISLAGRLPENALVLRSFGKFYGLAGLRLGFVVAATPIAAAFRAEVGPWPVSGPAIEIGTAALHDAAWRDQTIVRLAQVAERLDRLAEGAGWSLVGGTSLFRTYDTPDAAAAQERLARHRIWSRIFPYSDRWLRLGLPDEAGWDRLAGALS